MTGEARVVLFWLRIQTTPMRKSLFTGQNRLQIRHHLYPRITGLVLLKGFWRCAPAIHTLISPTLTGTLTFWYNLSGYHQRRSSTLPWNMTNCLILGYLKARVTFRTRLGTSCKM